MDLSSKEFDLRARAEEGSWCQLVHPITGVALGVAEGKPCRILIQGVDSKAWDISLAKAVALRAGEARRPPGLSEEQVLATVDQQAEDDARHLAAISLGWENLEWDKKKVDNKEVARLVYGSYKWIREQLYAHSNNRAQYAGNA